MKENHPKLSQVCNYGICFKGPKNEFETSVVNEPSVFEPLKFYCIIIFSKIDNSTCINDEKQVMIFFVLRFILLKKGCWSDDHAVNVLKVELIYTAWLIRLFYNTIVRCLGP